MVETVALRQGLPPDAISSLLDLALSLRAGRGIGFYSITNLVIKINITSMYYCPNFFHHCTGGVTCLRILKFLIPASVVPQEAIVRCVSWLCVGKMTVNVQVVIYACTFILVMCLNYSLDKKNIPGF